MNTNKDERNEAFDGIGQGEASKLDPISSQPIIQRDLFRACYRFSYATRGMPRWKRVVMVLQTISKVTKKKLGYGIFMLLLRAGFSLLCYYSTKYIVNPIRGIR
jgi:hypothetical protein|tara:strand:+ start:1064 stop:1375 length:312 start_codon:yes stop_codon:yes gene_type:complete